MRYIRQLLLVAAASLAAVSLGACNATTGGNPPAPVACTDIVCQVQQATTNICSFVPAAETVAAIIASFVGGSGGVSLVSSVATALCSAVVPAPKQSVSLKHMKARYASSQLSVGDHTVNGVTVKGFFTR